MIPQLRCYFTVYVTPFVPPSVPNFIRHPQNAVRGLSRRVLQNVRGKWRDGKIGLNRLSPDVIAGQSFVHQRWFHAAGPSRLLVRKMGSREC